MSVRGRKREGVEREKGAWVEKSETPRLNGHVANGTAQ